MSKQKEQKKLESDVQKEMRDLKVQLKKMIKVNKYSFIEHPARLLAFQFTIGLVRGIGSFIGATIVIAVIVYILSRLGLTGIIQDLNSLRSI